ncbi:hypothetical protein BK741_07210 [Bacillus thuringiensis serovar iberica]|uniref:Uncharacterized protein n=1 Tax=Bacillus thuringiensis serovar iberica TaxID=180866 RepID=A0A9X6L9D0_BACTU|nr:hypothetical protein BK741_29975 [Bacillus thuringiensis serovar iberica]OUB51502.1 hypothetical protein BK741_08420 [Bacillus thuringiensis serovar iberica]OUB52100.1 hypothetical protein BK741_07210 [Bacillus thuringiensis serovar iberica]
MRQDCLKLHAATGTLLSPEGLNKRLNIKTVLFYNIFFLYSYNKEKICEQIQIANQLLLYFGVFWMLLYFSTKYFRECIIHNLKVVFKHLESKNNRNTYKEGVNRF